MKQKDKIDGESGAHKLAIKYFTPPQCFIAMKHFKKHIFFF